MKGLIVALLIFIFLNAVTILLNKLLNFGIQSQEIQGIIGGYAVIIVALLGIKSFKEKPNISGVTCFKNRELANITAELVNISEEDEITIFILHLKYVVELFQRPDVKSAIFTKKPKIRIYTLDPDNDDAILNKLCLYFSKNSATEMKESMNLRYELYQDEIKSDFITNGIDIELKLLHIDNASVPIPPFQYYSVNNFVYINPLTTVHVPIKDLVADEFASSKGKTTRDTFHMKFDLNNNDARKLVNDYKITFNYYRNEKFISRTV